MMKNKKIWIALVALIAVAALITGLYFATRPKPKDRPASKDQPGTVEEITITVTVVHKNGEEKEFTCKTTESYLGPVLVQEGIVKDNQDGGHLYILEVDGELADFNADQGWWKLYVGDTQSNYGADEVPIEDGGSYKLVYTIGFDAY